NRQCPHTLIRYPRTKFQPILSIPFRHPVETLGSARGRKAPPYIKIASGIQGKSIHGAGSDSSSHRKPLFPIPLCKTTKLAVPPNTGKVAAGVQLPPGTY